MKTLQQFIHFDSNDYLSKLSKKDLFYFFILLDNYYLEYRKSLEIPNKYTFGIEIEAEYIGEEFHEEIKKYFNQGWKRENEATLKNGDEYISPIMTDTEQNWNQLEELCDILKKEYEISRTCGGHIHVGADILESKKENWLHFLKLWGAYENIIFRFSYGEFLNYRRCNNMRNYARPISYKLDVIFQKGELQDYNTMDTIHQFSLTRSDSLNFSNIKNTTKEYGNTIEIRCPNGTLEPIIWQNNINFFVKLILFSKSRQYDEERIEKRFEKMREKSKNYSHIDVNQAIELADMIFSNNLDKVYFLRQYLKSFQTSNETNDLKKAKKFIKNKS